MADNNANGNPLAGEPNANQPQAGTPTTPPAGDTDSTRTTYSKEEYDRLKKDKQEANNEAKNLRERFHALETEKALAEAQKLKEAGEFKALYEQTEAKVKELEPVAEENKFLRDYAMKQLEATIKDWPAEALKGDPGKNASLQTRLAWIENTAPLVAIVKGNQQQQRQAGLVRSPEPNNNQNGRKTREDYEKEFRVARPF